jgi:uncharacterized protein
MNKVVFLLALTGASTFCLAQTPARPPFIRASGEGVVSIRPDQARVSVGVNTQAATAEEATQRNAEIVTNVLAEIRRVIGTQGEIRTTGFNVSPVYRTPMPGQPAVIAGYSVTNSVEVTMNDVNLAGRVLDAGVKAGANTIGGIRFSLRDPQPVRAQALRLATQQARLQAEAIAQGLGGRTGRILAATDATSVAVTSARDAAGIGAPAVQTPVETGTLEVRATVTIEAEIVILQ